MLQHTLGLGASRLSAFNVNRSVFTLLLSPLACALSPAFCRILAFTMAIETEIKFKVADLPGLAQRLQDAGFNLHTERSFESNVLYDTPDRQLRARTEILRIRSYAGRWTVTHKRIPTDRPGEDSHKHRVETETEVADGNALAEVFLSLGLVPAFRYEKWRTEWHDGEGHCVVDETPIGNYAELEGPPEWIDRVAARLGVAADYITLSYGRLFDQWREANHSRRARPDLLCLLPILTFFQSHFWSAYLHTPLRRPAAVLPPIPLKSGRLRCTLLVVSACPAEGRFMSRPLPPIKPSAEAQWTRIDT